MPPVTHGRRRAHVLAVLAVLVVAAGCTASTDPEPRPSSPSPSVQDPAAISPGPEPTGVPSIVPSPASTPPPPVTTTPPEDVPASTEPGTLVVTSTDGVLSRVDPVAGTVDPVDGVTGAAQATPSADGSTLVFSRIVDGEPVVTVRRDGGSTDVAVPTPPYFHLVAPTGDHVVSLGDATDTDQVSVLVTDVAAGTSREVDRGRPYFLSWRSDGAVLAANIDGSLVATVDPDGAREPLAIAPGAFQAPAWTDDDRLVVVVEDTGVDAVPVTTRVAAGTNGAGRHAHAVAQPSGGTLAVVDPDGGATTPLSTVAGAVSFDVASDRVAWVAGDSGQAASLGPLEVVGLDGRDRATITERDVAMFEWSPDGRRLLFHVVDPDRGFVPHVWDGSTVTAYPPFLPTPTLAVQYLPFWPQYTLAVTQWAPDGSAFTVVDAGDGDAERPGTVVVQELDGTRREVAPGEMAVWSR